MLSARDIMTKDLITVSPDTEIIQAAKLLLDHHINGLPVVDAAGRLLGILCQSDLVSQQKRMPLPSVFTLLDSFIPISSPKNMQKEIDKIVATTVAQAMTPHPVTVTPGTSLEDVASLMVDKKLHTLPVVEQGQLVGVIGKEDVLRTLMPGTKED